MTIGALQVASCLGDGMDMQLTRILLVDDHALYREGLRELIDRWDGFCVIGEAENGQEAIDFCEKTLPDVVLMDVQMPVKDGVEATGILHERYPELPIVMLTVTGDEDSLFDAIRNGARGYILKNTHARQLKTRLRDVLRGDSVLSSEVTGKVMAAAGKQGGSTQTREARIADRFLTEQERLILKYVALGESNREVGAHLSVSEGTVKKQLSTILLKLGLSNRVQAATFAMRAGIAD